MQRWTRGILTGALLLAGSLAAPGGMAAQDTAPENDARHFQPMDVFGLEWASDPQVSPDGSQVVYVR
ncbi:MAG TPA: hypothetical protein VLA43_04665, partial [Longimicrobiales bacterium]|nr:hypothetical protein [Longimicrobiales bacterium]